LRYVRGASSSGVSRRIAALEAWPGKNLKFLAQASIGDAHMALRSLRRRPSFTLMAAATLGLGLGSTAAVFAMVNQLVLRPLPGAANAESAAYLQLGIPGRYAGVTMHHFDELRARS